MPIIIDTLLPKYETGPQAIRSFQSINCELGSMHLRENLYLLNLIIHFSSCSPIKKKRSMAEKSKILIIGGTGNIGKFLVEASAKAGHPTFALIREGSVHDPVKSQLIGNFKNQGVTLLYV